MVQRCREPQAVQMHHGNLDYHTIHLNSRAHAKPESQHRPHPCPHPECEYATKGFKTKSHLGSHFNSPAHSSPESPFQCPHAECEYWVFSASKPAFLSAILGCSHTQPLQMPNRDLRPSHSRVPMDRVSGVPQVRHARFLHVRLRPLPVRLRPEDNEKLVEQLVNADQDPQSSMVVETIV